MGFNVKVGVGRARKRKDYTIYKQIKLKLLFSLITQKQDIATDKTRETVASPTLHLIVLAQELHTALILPGVHT